MAGERILVADHSAAVQDISKAILEEHGYRVLVASNGLATLTHPEIAKFDLLVVDRDLDGIDGLETSRQVKTDKELYKIPVLLLVPGDSLDLLESVPLKGATGWLAKPFSPAKLLVKVQEVIEEQKLRSLSTRYLEQAADAHMRELAEQKIQTAVERKIQIIVERAIQSIVSIIDSRAKREVEGRVTSLVSDKEQELVKLTVQEVAHSMIEKLAERKVTEAMAVILQAQTEATVRAASEQMLPPMVRDRLREAIDAILPKEVEHRTQAAAEARADEIGQSIVTIIQQQAAKTVPIIAKESIPELAERQVEIVASNTLPRLITDTARQAIQQEMSLTIRPTVDKHVARVRNTVIFVGALILIALVITFTILFLGGLAEIRRQAGL